ncbi:hypothetical protein [Algoriphagus sp. Y33]|uniref:hypothetical protein n=1 Tax=Algoriphagus sp. Y33 TaxID=2772483 RepID=UPI001785CC60|nr:hypothetical protein [Algoriphagus sp. Y33]
MKLTTINLLRGGVFSLAVVAAFAFTQPKGNNPEYGTPDNGETWYLLDELVPGEDYRCIPGSQSCTFSDSTMTSPNDSPVHQFILLP